MPDYRLTRKAEEDLLRIAVYGLERYGRAASQRYRDKLEARFLELAEKPEISPRVEHIREGYRRNICGVNAIYYRVERRGIVIVRVLGRQDPDEAL